MYKTFFIITILLFAFTPAQTHRFIYELSINKTDDKLKVNMILDINKNKVSFYDYEFYELDSIGKVTGKFSETNSESDQLITRNGPNFENKSYHTHTYDYFVISSNEKIDWKLQKETKKVDQYILQKATASFGGRDWTAWFCKEIPFQEGPYKFRGLSGLIFEIYDSENIFRYTLIKSINLPETYETTNFLETHYGKKPIRVSLKQYQKIKLEYYTNIVEVLNSFVKKGGSIASDEKLESPEDIAKRRKSLQESIKKYYLPIERDKAIPYPNN